MKKQDLFQYLDEELQDKLYGFCYARSRDGHEAQELYSDLLFALVKAAKSDGEVENPQAFIWRVARNVYADFSEARRRKTDVTYQGDADELLRRMTAEGEEQDDEEALRGIYRRIAFLSKAYRDVMVLYYLEGLATAEIAEKLQISEVAVRQRLFAAREKIREEMVEEAKKEWDIAEKPLNLDHLDYVIYGNGSPSSGDPRLTQRRLLSKHVLWLCRKKAMSAAEIAGELNVPTLYVEDELEILTQGENGKYGLLRRTENGKYIINFVLFDREEMQKAHAIYKEIMPAVTEAILRFVQEHREEYLALPYINKRVDMNLILWQQVHPMALLFAKMVAKCMEEQFPNLTPVDRPFSIYGHVDYGKQYGGSWNAVDNKDVGGYAYVSFENIGNAYMKRHFACKYGLFKDPMTQLTIRAFDGVEIASLTPAEKEIAAKAVEYGYIFREEGMLHVKILVCEGDADSLFAVTYRLAEGPLNQAAEWVAARLAGWIKRNLPKHLQNEWRYANFIASMPVLDLLLDALIERGLLALPETELGAEGCWMTFQRYPK